LLASCNLLSGNGVNLFAKKKENKEVNKKAKINTKKEVIKEVQ